MLRDRQCHTVILSRLTACAKRCIMGDRMLEVSAIEDMGQN